MTARVMQGPENALACGVHVAILTLTFVCQLFYVRNVTINGLACQGKAKFLKECQCLYRLINTG